jgi:hypothetical protein
MSQIEKVAKHLNRHSKTGGISAKKLANLAHVPLVISTSVSMTFALSKVPAS